MRVFHIEVVSKLDTNRCLNATMRFIARRGKPSTIISDNGTIFLLELKESLHSTLQSRAMKDRRTSNLTRNQMEVQLTLITSL